MSDLLHYWRWIRINSQGKRTVEEIPQAQAFLRQQFPDLFNGEISDGKIQNQLVQLIKTANQPEDRELAQCCLRCFISYRIDWVCRDLALKFGEKGQFTHLDLLPFVLNEAEVLPSQRSRAQPSRYQSLASKILETFDPAQSQLSTWTKRLVTSDADLTAFLASCGVRLLSSWAVLNSATASWLQRRLTLPSADMTQALALLDSYGRVYKRDRLTRSKGPCPAPTTAQLTEMADLLQARSGRSYSPTAVLELLHRLADQIREASHPRVESLDDDSHRGLADQPVEPEPEPEYREFLKAYRTQFIAALQAGIEQTVQNRFAGFSRKDAVKAQQFMQALFWFHCLAFSMTEIGKRLQCRQYNVTRLLDLSELREDTKRKTWIILREQVKTLAAEYKTIEQLEQIMAEIDAAIEEQIEQILEAERKQASTAGRSIDQQFQSPFSRLLCDYLDHCSYFTPGD